MGRVARYKRIAKDDPFAPKRATKVDDTVDLAPSKKELSGAGGMTRSMRMFMKAQERVKRLQERARFNRLSPEDKAKPENQLKFKFASEEEKSMAQEFAPETTKPSALPQVLGQQEGESYYEMKERVYNETAPMLQGKVNVDTRRVEKQRDYYKKKQEKQKAKKQQRNSDDELDEEEGKIGDFKKLSKDLPQFGEQAQRPPTFKKLPRNSAKADLQIAKRVATEGTSGPLTAFKEKKKVAQLAQFDRSATPSTHVTKTVQTEQEKRAMDDLRKQVQDRYRELKASRIKARTSAISAKPSEVRRKGSKSTFHISADDMEKYQSMIPESSRSLKKARKEQMQRRR